MSLWKSLLGRTEPKQANLDALFSLPTAGITLQASLGMRPTGVGSVCFRAAEGAAFQATRGDLVELMRADGTEVTETTDSYGFTWLTDRHDPSDLTGLVTELHGVNSTLEAQGFGPGLLCSLVHFEDAAGRRVALVYLYKQGTFYPFAPKGPEQRDNLFEIQIRDAIGTDLPIEKDVSRWMAVWGAPEL